MSDEFDVHDEAEIEAIKDFPFDRVSLLLDIMQKQTTIAPKATSIFGIAQAELDILNQQAKDIATARGQKIKEADQRKAAAESQRVEAEAKAQSRQLRPEPKAIPAVHAEDDTSEPDMSLGAPIQRRV